MDIRGDRASFYERNKPKQVRLNYTFLDFAYLSTTIENNISNDKTTAQSVDATVSFDIFNQIAGSLSINGGALTVNNTVFSTTELQAGFLYHYPLDKKADIYAGVQLISISIDNPNSTTALDASGRSVNLGLRHGFTDTMEWGIGATYFDIDDVQHTQIHLSLTYGSDKEIQYTLRYESDDATNKSTSVKAGIRFNF